MRPLVFVWLILCILCAAPVSARAAVVVIGDRADRTIRADGTKDDGSSTRLGSGSNEPGPGARSIVFVFQLPTPFSSEQPIVAKADLQFTIATDLADGAYNIDLYGIAARTAATVQSSDGFAGARDANAMLIQDDILPPITTYTGVVHTSEEGNMRLVDYLNGSYGPDGSGAGKWVFLRLNPDLIPPPTEDSGMLVFQANNATGKLDSQKPILTIAFVPEPGMVCIGTFLFSLILRRGRRLRTRESQAQHA